MLTVGTRVKVVAFIVLALSVLAYIASTYADLGRYVGLRGYYVVKLELPATGGLFEGSAVSYRGITVGEVGRLDLSDDGVLADLRIRNSAPDIPRGLRAVVADRSAVGEQYVDLQPTTAAGPFLAQDSTIPRSAATLPPPVTTTLTSVNNLTASVPLQALQTVIGELGEAFTGQGPHLQQLLDTGGKFINESDINFPTTQALIDNGGFVLTTQNEEAAAFKAFARNSRLLAAQLRAHDRDFRAVIAAAPGAAREFSALVDDLTPEFGILIARLLTLARVGEARPAALEELFKALPQVAAMGATITSSGRLNLGLVNTFFNPQPCTRGYGRTRYRNGTDLSTAPAFNTGARCTESPGTGINVRGSANAPRKGVPAEVRPGSIGAQSGAAEVLGTLGLPALDGGQTDLSALLGVRP